MAEENAEGSDGAANSASGNSPSDADGSASEQLMNAQKEAEKFKNEYLYLYAEFENYKKHAVKDRSELKKYGNERLLVDLLSVLDVFDTALQVELTAENLATFKKGVEMTAANLRQVLQKHGVEEVPAQGVQFNPSMHEALSGEPSSDAAEGTVLRVFKRGYKLHDRVIRPGQVVVATKPAT